jgi:hypothetical protein
MATTDQQSIEALVRWNELSRANVENALVSTMLDGAFKAHEPIDTFTTWLLAGAGAVASYFLSNADKLIPFLGKAGFVTAGVLLCLSGVFGLISKGFGLRFKAANEASAAFQAVFISKLEAYEPTESQIQAAANAHGLQLETEVRMQRVLEQFFSVLPRWVKWLALRQLRKNAGHPQIGYISRVKSLHAQSVCAFLQAVLFIAFLAAGFIFAAAI